MSTQPQELPTLTITAVADGLAYVRGRIVPGGPGRRWEYLETHHSRESALEAARAEGGPLRMEAETLSSDRTDGIAPTRPPADS